MTSHNPRGRSRRLAGAVLVALGLAGSPAVAQDAAMPTAVCTQPGCFEADATGVVTGKLTGKAGYRLSPTGDLLIMLATAGALPVTLIIARDRAGVPAAETLFPLADGCDNDVADLPDDAVSLTVRGGQLLTPSWIARAHTGSVRLARSPDGEISGRFAMTGCGERVESGDLVTVTLRGSFRAGRVK